MLFENKVIAQKATQCTETKDTVQNKLRNTTGNRTQLHYYDKTSIVIFTHRSFKLLLMKNHARSSLEVYAQFSMHWVSFFVNQLCCFIGGYFYIFYPRRE